MGCLQRSVDALRAPECACSSNHGLPLTGRMLGQNAERPGPKPGPFTYEIRSLSVDRVRRVLDTRDVLHDAYDLAGVAELVVVPDVQLRVLAVDQRRVGVDHRRGARADEVAGHRVVGGRVVEATA